MKVLFECCIMLTDVQDSGEELCMMLAGPRIMFCMAWYQHYKRCQPFARNIKKIPLTS